MEVKCENNKLVIYWDCDDVLVNSSSHLQNQVNDKTCFKTDTLKVLEQLKRNCEYLRDEVKEECMTSFANRRMPILRHFPTFENISFNNRYPFFTFGRMTKKQYEEIYEKPILSCEYYIKVVDLLLNQYLEERDSFLEKDNLPKGKTIKYDDQKEQENRLYFQKLIDNNRNALKRISEFCLTEIIKMSLFARSIHTNKPNYGSLIKMDGNDIIRDEKVFNTSREYLLYEKPVNDIKKTLESLYLIDDIITNLEEYKEVSHELIDYSRIYSLENVNWKAVNVILRLEDCPFVEKQYILSHHNGGREEICKKNLFTNILPQIPFIGVRFHNEEHTGARRARNNKFFAAEEYCDNPRLMVIIDDSLVNNRDFSTHDANCILSRKKTLAELIQNELEKTSYQRITEYNYDEIANILESYYLKAQEKVKTKSL